MASTTPSPDQLLANVCRFNSKNFYYIMQKIALNVLMTHYLGCIWLIIFMEIVRKEIALCKQR